MKLYVSVTLFSSLQIFWETYFRKNRFVKMAFYVGNKGTWDEWRFFVKRITLIFCFRINRTIYPDLIRLSHLYFLSSFLRERDDLQKVKISLHDEHLLHTYTHDSHSCTHTIHDFEQWCYEPNDALEVKKRQKMFLHYDE